MRRYERRNKLKEVRRHNKEKCEREHGQKHKRGTPEENCEEAEFWRKWRKQRDMVERTLLGLQLDAQSWKKFHAMRTNSSGRTGVMDDPHQSRDTPDETTAHKVTHISTEEP